MPADPARPLEHALAETSQRPDRVELRGFRVQLFRSIVDSGEVPVFPLTALVGRNRSGKTSLLEALYRLHPGTPRGYDAHRDWPADRRRQGVASVAPCTAEFELPEEVARGFAKGGGELPRRLRIARTYGGELLAELDGARIAEAVADLLPPFVLLAREGLLESSIELLKPGNRHSSAEESVFALFAVAGLERNELDAHTGRAARRRRLAEASLRLTERLGGGRTFAFESSGGLLALFVAQGSARLRSLEALDDAERWRITLDVLLAHAGGTNNARPVLLLDEPAGAFRGRGEAALAEELARLAQHHTVLHTAPMPFHTTLAHDEQVLVLGWSETGPRVRGAPLPGKEGGWELRAALGMGGRRGFLVAETSLVVEGSQDAQMLEVLILLARRSGEAGLPADIGIVAAGGAWEVAHVAAFLARRGLGVVALFDGDDAGRAGRAGLLERLHTQPTTGRVLALDVGRILGLRQRTSSLEDLFPPDWYLDQVRGLGPAPDSLPPGEMLTARVEAAFAAAGARFDKSAVNEAVREALGRAASLDDLPPELARRIRRLLLILRRALERVR